MFGKRTTRQTTLELPFSRTEELFFGHPMPTDISSVLSVYLFSSSCHNIHAVIAGGIKNSFSVCLPLTPGVAVAIAAASVAVAAVAAMETVL